MADIYKRAAREGSADGVEEEALERRLDHLFARGRVAHPSLELSDEAFVAHLALCEAAVVDALSQLHAEDLYLACACLAGSHAALSQLRAESKPIVARYLGRIDGSGAIFEDVEQQLWAGALVGTEEGPKLTTYAGRGPLGGWIGVSAQRIALMILRHERVEARAREEAAAQLDLIGDDPELGAVKERFREQFQAALEAALDALDAREKTLYRMHLVDGLPSELIGKVYGVHQTTVIRWLSAARERIADEAKRRLRATVPVSSGEFDSIARLLLSQLELNVSMMLKNRS